MLHFEFGQDRLIQPHSLSALKLVEGSTEIAVERCFVAVQMIEQAETISEESAS